MFHAPIVSAMIVSSGVQGPNPLDFTSVMEKIRGKTGSFFFLKSSPCLLFLSCFLWAYCDVRKIDLF